MTDTPQTTNKHCGYHADVKADWTKLNKETLTKPLEVDCHGQTTVHHYDSLESLALRTLRYENKPANAEAVQRMEDDYVTANSKIPGLESLGCNKDFIETGWKLKVPEAPEKPCDTQVPPAPTPEPEALQRGGHGYPKQNAAGIPPCTGWNDDVERMLNGLPYRKEDIPPCTGWNDDLERLLNGSPYARNRGNGVLGRNQIRVDGNTVIYNEQGGVINFNDGDCGEPTIANQGRTFLPSL